ncbi:hypothetical protein K443DRAFT_135571 [Laccaria amethystina LaAM-08-1]|uniref:Uncharacterized protein n=1 Tax=Laccaria amethystina LaAM-08-1 TaxID=1095629 RepID=A0A0C9WSL9_9AGAR|nr:hypothetical protein K443DRAFT_135571 [Laccaria amethystina LaAM-08-1]
MPEEFARFSACSEIPLKNIRIGDAVCVTSGDHQGFIGWVVNKEANDPSIFNDKTGNKVRVSSDIVNFFTPDFHYNATAPKFKLHFMAAQKDAMKSDSNNHLVGKHVTKITLPIPYSHLLHPTVPPPEVLATPLPNLQDIPTSPAWNPSLHTPCPGDDASPPYWLRDSCFNGMKLSLQFIHTYPDFFNRKHEGKCGKFQQVIWDTVQIRDSFQMLEVPFKYLIPVRPEAACQTSTAFDGPHKGCQFKIQYVCGCSDLKASSDRRKINTKIPMKDLVATWG